MTKKKKPEPTKNEKQLEAQLKRVKKTHATLKKKRDERTTGMRKRSGPIKRSRELHDAACEAGESLDAVPADRAKANAARLDKVKKAHAHYRKLEDEKKKFSLKMRGLVREAEEKHEEAIESDQLHLIPGKAKRGPKKAPKK